MFEEGKMFDEWNHDRNRFDLLRIEPIRPDRLDLPRIELPREDLTKFVKYTGPPYYDIDNLPRSSNGMLVPPPGIPPSPF